MEYWVIDGGSTDESCSVAAEFELRLTFVSERDEGQSDAINKGFSRVTGDIIGWINADDYYKQSTFKKVSEVFLQNPEIGLVYGNAEFVDVNGTILDISKHVEPFNFHKLITIGNYITQPAAFFRRSAFEAVGALRTDLNWAMDYDLWIRLGKTFGALYINETLACVRCYPGTKTASGGRARHAEIEQMIKGHGGPGLPAYCRLEAAALSAQETFQFADNFEFSKAFAAAIETIEHAFGSRRSITALLSPRTWQIIRTAYKRDSIALRGQ